MTQIPQMKATSVLSPSSSRPSSTSRILLYLYLLPVDQGRGDVFRISDFGFGSSFGLRHSGFLIQVSSFGLPVSNLPETRSLKWFLDNLKPETCNLKLVRGVQPGRQNMDVATDDEVEFLAGRVRPETWWLSPVNSHKESTSIENPTQS